MYDVIVIGGGPAGYNGALKCAKLNLSVALIEERELGGTCLNRGCIPTKSLLKSAEIFESAKNGEVFGVKTDNVFFDMDKVYQRKDSVVKKLREGIAYLIKKSGLDYFEGKASFVDNHTVKIEKDGEATEIAAKNIIIATGSVPARLKLIGIEYTKNSDEVLEKGISGNNVLIIGGGVIGCEFACFLSTIGKKVTIVEAEGRILPQMDRDASNYLGLALRKNKVDIVTGAKVLSVVKDGENLSVNAEVKGAEKTFACEEVIVSVGRNANFGGLNLEKANIMYDRRIIVDEYFATSANNIYAVGDVCSKIQLAHLAEAQATNVAHILAGKKPPIDLSVVPSCVYTCPEIACVGKTELEEGFSVSKVPFGGNGKAVIEDCYAGFVKTVYDKDNIIVGAVVMCSRATDIIAELALAVCNKLKREDIEKTIHAHPTLAENVRVSAES
ncbi:dihydrolipoyl dehydrogenase [bacterium]|nr:dihydrolipoyl dehydrogenase [bacterium]